MPLNNDAGTASGEYFAVGERSLTPVEVQRVRDEVFTILVREENACLPDLAVKIRECTAEQLRGILDDMITDGVIEHLDPQWDFRDYKKAFPAFRLSA